MGVSASHAQEATATPTPTAASASEKQKTVVDVVKKEADEDSVFKLDIAIPESPALTLLGVEGVTQANSLKPVLLKLPSLMASGEPFSGAVEVTPLALVHNPRTLSYRNYDTFTSLLFRTHIGVAGYQGVADTDTTKQRSSRLSVGISSSVLSASDPLRAKLPGIGGPAWETCLNLNHIQIANDLPRFEPTQEMKDLSAAILADMAAGRDPHAKQVEYARLSGEVQAVAREEWAKTKSAGIVDTCKLVADRAARMGSDLDLGGGVVWEGLPGKFRGFDNPAAVFWMSARTTLSGSKPHGNNYADLVAWLKDDSPWFTIATSGRVGVSESVATGDATKPKILANSYTGWMSLEGHTERAILSFQIGFQKTDPRLAADSAFAGTRFTYLGSLDYRIAKGVWLGGSYGRANGVGSLKSDSRFRLSVSFDQNILAGLTQK
jgi:hypothetical protein